MMRPYKNIEGFLILFKTIFHGRKSFIFKKYNHVFKDEDVYEKGVLK